MNIALVKVTGPEQPAPSVMNIASVKVVSSQTLKSAAVATQDSTTVTVILSLSTHPLSSVTVTV
jgi:hypothetical protein